MLHVIQTLPIPLLQPFCKSGQLDVKDGVAGGDGVTVSSKGRLGWQVGWRGWW
jgi:hypothetical protein